MAGKLHVLLQRNRELLEVLEVPNGLTVLWILLESEGVLENHHEDHILDTAHKNNRAPTVS